MTMLKAIATASCCLLVLFVAQEANASFRLLQNNAAGPVADFEAAEFSPPPSPETGSDPPAADGAAPGSTPTPELFSPPEDYTPPEDESSQGSDFEEAAFPTDAPEIPASPEESAASPSGEESASFDAQSPQAEGPKEFETFEEPRDKPCGPFERTQLKEFFTCDNFDGYYCLASQFGATGGNCEGGGQYRCEPLSSEPSVYGIIASYPYSSAIHGYCTSSDDCDTDQFCDKAPQRPYFGDVPVGNCVAYLVQGCLG